MHHRLVCGQREERGSCRWLRPEEDEDEEEVGLGRGGAAIMSDAPRGTLALWGCASPGRTACRPAAQTPPRSAWPPRRRTWWLTGSAATSGTQMRSGKDCEGRRTQAEEMLHRGQEVRLWIRELLVHLMSDDRSEHNEDLRLVPDYNAVFNCAGLTLIYTRHRFFLFCACWTKTSARRWNKATLTDDDSSLY